MSTLQLYAKSLHYRKVSATIAPNGWYFTSVRHILVQIAHVRHSLCHTEHSKLKLKFRVIIVKICQIVVWQPLAAIRGEYGMPVLEYFV